MRLLAVIPLALLSVGAAAPGQPRPVAQDRAAPAAPALAPQALPGEMLLTPPAHCLDAQPRRTDGRPLRPRRLDRLPPGDLSLTVMREIGGCPQPVTIREGYGAPALRDGK